MDKSSLNALLLSYILMKKGLNLITINVPVVYMGRYEVVLRGDYP